MNNWTEYERILFVVFLYFVGVIIGYCWGKHHD